MHGAVTGLSPTLQRLISLAAIIAARGHRMQRRAGAQRPLIETCACLHISCIHREPGSDGPDREYTAMVFYLPDRVYRRRADDNTHRTPSTCE